MHDAQSVEAVLARLMPPALSEAGQREIENMIAGLAPADAPQTAAKPARPRIWPIVGGIAAAVTLLAAITHSTRLSESSIAAKVEALATPETSPFEWLSESDRVEAVKDDGWRDSPEGSAMRAMRMRVVEEDRLLDIESGIVMRISEPRDELLLMPVHSF